MFHAMFHGFWRLSNGRLHSHGFQVLPITFLTIPLGPTMMKIPCKKWALWGGIWGSASGLCPDDNRKQPNQRESRHVGDARPEPGG